LAGNDVFISILENVIVLLATIVLLNKNEIKQKSFNYTNIDILKKIQIFFCHSLEKIFPIHF